MKMKRHWEECCSQTPIGLGSMLPPLGNWGGGKQQVGDIVYISPWMRDSEVGNWTFNVPLPTVVRNAEIYNADHNDGDYLQFKDYFPAGTYTCKMITSKDSNRGIGKVKIDGITVMTIDQYNGVLLVNQISTQAGITIATSGVKTIQLIVDGKNGSSSDHYFPLSEMLFYRTV